MRGWRRFARGPAWRAARFLLPLVVVAAPLVAPGHAEAGTLAPPDPAAAGVIVDATDGRAVPATLIEALDRSGRIVARAFAREDGTFRLVAANAGPLRLRVARLGYRSASLGPFAPGTPAARELRVALQPAPLVADAVVVTASRRPQLDSSAPAATSVLGPRELQGHTQLTPVDAVRDVPGMDFASKGLMQHTYAVRGYRSAMSSAVLVLTDHRYAALPVLGFNLPYLMPEIDDDIERIEVVRGPGAALYGPNSSLGVIHVVTRAPYEFPGTSLSLLGGGRSLRQGTLRHARRLGPRAAFKITASALRGHDWESFDPRDRARRDFDLERATGEARLDWFPGDDTALVLAAGRAVTTNIDLANTVGAVQARDWANTYLQARVRHRRLAGSLLWNGTDSGDTHALFTGAPIVDESRILAAQLSHEWRPRTGLDLLYGLDVRRSEPRTDGTLHGANEARDTVSEVGGYLSAEAGLRPGWQLVGAVRLDYHDRIEDLAISPRLGAVFRPAPEHAVRLTWNRAFNSPTANDLFMDVDAGFPLPTGIPTRLRGIPRDGLRFGGPAGLAMRSPLAEGGESDLLPLDATRLWSGVLGMLGPEAAEALGSVPVPGPLDVATNLGLLDPREGTFRPLAREEIADVEPDGRVLTSTVEVGYKGRFGDRIAATIDLYRSRVDDFFGELYAVTPNAFLDAGDLERWLLANGIAPEQAAALSRTVGSLPVGTVVPHGCGSADVLLANRQGGSYDLWGVDLGLRLGLSRRLALTASYSWLSENTVLDHPEVGRMFLSVPRNKGALGLQWQEDRRGRSAWLQARAVEGFPVVSGSFAGDVAGYAVVDLGAEWRLRARGDVRFGLTALNVLDRRHSEFVGAPELGRLILTRVRVSI